MADTPFAKKSLGQHWLQDAGALQAMCAAATVEPGDTVLEIGPGFGSLTAHLLEKGAAVLALEFDETLTPILRQKYSGAIQSGQLTVEQGDIRSFDFGSMPSGYKIVANIPYYLTSNLIQLLSETSNPPSLAALLVQKEVAERLAAKPGAMSLLSVTAQFYWQVGLGAAVPAKLFSPPPKVDSQIVILQRRQTLLLPDKDVKAFFRLVKAGYSQRRKTLLNSLSGGLRLDRSSVAELCQTASIDSKRRPQTLSLEDWRALYQKLAVLSVED